VHRRRPVHVPQPGAVELADRGNDLRCQLIQQPQQLAQRAPVDRNVEVADRRGKRREHMFDCSELILPIARRQ
jgi:hypothetical protein